MPPSALNTTLKNSPEEYFDRIRFQVTRHFCIFCFILAMLAIPSSFLAKDRTTLIINATAFLLYAIPLVISTRTKKYVMAARIYICIAMVLLVANAIAANFDISLATTAWYFVYLVFAYLVLNFAWAVAVGIVAVTSVSVFATLRLLRLHALNPHLSQDSITIGSWLTLIVALVALLYLLTIYKRLRDVMFHEIVASDKEKSQLVGIMSHDMRNYLGAVQGIASLIQDDMESCSDKMVAQETINKTNLIDQATVNALQMVEGVVAVARDTVGNKI